MSCVDAQPTLDIQPLRAVFNSLLVVAALVMMCCRVPARASNAKILGALLILFAWYVAVDGCGGGWPWCPLLSR